MELIEETVSLNINMDPTMRAPSTRVAIEVSDAGEGCVSSDQLETLVRKTKSKIKEYEKKRLHCDVISKRLKSEGIGQNVMELGYGAIYTSKHLYTAKVKIYNVFDVQRSAKTKSFKEYSDKPLSCFEHTFLAQTTIEHGVKDDCVSWQEHIFVRQDRISYKAQIFDENGDSKPAWLWKVRAYDREHTYLDNNKLCNVEDNGIFFVTINPDSMIKIDGNIYKRIYGYSKLARRCISYCVSLIFNCLFLNELWHSGDYIFFTSGLVCLIFGLFLYYGYVIYSQMIKDSKFKFIFLIPILNVMAFKLSSDPFDNTGAVGMDFLTLATINLPLYLIDVAYILQSVNNYNELSVFIWLQLINSIVMACVVICVGAEWFAERYSYCDKGLSLSIMDKMKIKMIIFCTFVPVILIEVTQFFPFLFYYYVEIESESDTEIKRREGLVFILLLFSASKLLFVFDVWHHVVVNQKLSRYQKGLTMFFFGIFFFLTPMVPYIFMLIDKKESKNCKFEKQKNVFGAGFCSAISRSYFILSFYLICAYGISCLYIIINRENEQISSMIQAMIAINAALVLYCILFLPKLYYLTLRYMMKGLDQYEAFAQWRDRAESNTIAQNIYSL